MLQTYECPKKKNVAQQLQSSWLTSFPAPCTCARTRVATCASVLIPGNRLFEMFKHYTHFLRVCAATYLCLCESDFQTSLLHEASTIVVRYAVWF